jgi:hypothetical protein
MGKLSLGSCGRGVVRKGLAEAVLLTMLVIGMGKTGQGGDA